MRKFLLYFCGFVIVFFIAPAMCTATPKGMQETVADGNNQNSVQQSQEEENTSQGGADVTSNTNTTGGDGDTSQVGDNTQENPNSKTIKLLHPVTGEIEEISLDEYLYGVVSSEMPASYEMEALKAQAVVARTYTIYQMTHNSSKHENADICDNYACCQAWISKDDRFAKWNQEEAESNWNKIVDAVNSTSGKIVAYNGEPINAFFHSNSGGMTESSVNIWGGIDYPYLKSVETAGEEGYTQYNSQVQFTKEDLLNKIRGKYQDCEIDFSSQDCIKILEYTTSGRVKTIKFGNKEIAGTEARTILGLKSTNFGVSIDGNTVKFTVTGYGHGVGMSQTGADALAKSGSNYEEIIKHFYTDVEIVELKSL